VEPGGIEPTTLDPFCQPDPGPEAELALAIDLTLRLPLVVVGPVDSLSQIDADGRVSERFL